LIEKIALRFASHGYRINGAARSWVYNPSFGTPQIA